MQTEQASFQIDHDKLFALVSPSFGGLSGDDQPNPDEPLKPGPWDPIIRVALKDVRRFSPGLELWRQGPDPVPWTASQLRSSWISSSMSRELLGLIARRVPEIWDLLGGLRIGDDVFLNPQPLPPRERFIIALGEALVARAEQLAEVAGAFDSGEPNRSEERGIIIVSGYVNRLVDDWCGTGYRPRWPFPGPPPWWFARAVSARDTLALGAILNDAGRQAFEPVVGRALRDAATKLAHAGLERMEGQTQN
jgi:hypothetical protein